MSAEKVDPHRERADALVAAWMKDCQEPVCALSDELRLRAMLTRAFATPAPAPILPDGRVVRYDERVKA